jgi:hypothetical protein
VNNPSIQPPIMMCVSVKPSKAFPWSERIRAFTRMEPHVSEQTFHVINYNSDIICSSNQPNNPSTIRYNLEYSANTYMQHMLQPIGTMYSIIQSVLTSQCGSIILNPNNSAISYGNSVMTTKTIIARLPFESPFSR